MKSTYLLIMLFTLSYPLYKSFEDKVHYYSKWKHVVKSTVPVALFFILWDNWFTSIGVWKFNENFVLGLFVGYLPLEEYLFFFFVPFSCLFIYEVLLYFVKRDVLGKYSSAISWTLIFLSALMIGVYYDRIYPIILFNFIILVLLIHIYLIKSNYLGRFYLSFAVCIVPFLVVNGFLTGLPIITYNPQDIMGIHIYTIPLEDLFYGMLFLLLIISLYEYFKTKDSAHKIHS
jgi:lycopene cyclase domain-containing protein